MMKKLIRHINLIGHEINQSIEDGYPESDREIYCKRLHTITAMMQTPWRHTLVRLR